MIVYVLSHRPKHYGSFQAVGVYATKALAEKEAYEISYAWPGCDLEITEFEVME